jgi:hypothetical protein
MFFRNVLFKTTRRHSPQNRNTSKQTLSTIFYLVQLLSDQHKFSKHLEATQNSRCQVLTGHQIYTETHEHLAAVDLATGMCVAVHFIMQCVVIVCPQVEDTWDAAAGRSLGDRYEMLQTAEKEERGDRKLRGLFCCCTSHFPHDQIKDDKIG